MQALPVFLLLSFVVTGAVAPASAVAQDLDNVTIYGKVTDQTGAVIPAATVTATVLATNNQRTVVTDGEGNYRMIQLSPGLYSVKAFFTNFAAEEKQNLVMAGQSVQLDFILRPPTLAAQITVNATAEPTRVDVTRTVVGGTLIAREIESLPNPSRSALDLVFTLGGISEEPLSTRNLADDKNSRPTPEEAGNFSLSGGVAYSNNLTIDGLDNNDDRSARERFTPSLEAIAEVQIIRNQFAAEYGRASGGRINLRTRGGSNRFHGRGFYFFRDESLDANSWKNNSLGLKRLPLQQHNAGFTASGPLAFPLIYKGRNRTFFFTAYEYDTFLESTLIDALVPVDQNTLFSLPAPTDLHARRPENSASPALAAANGVAPFVSSVSTPQRNHVFTTRLDHKFSDLHHGSFLLQSGRLHNLRQFGGGFRLAGSMLGRTRNSDALSFSDSYVFSGKFVAQTRLQLSRLAPAVSAVGGTSTPVVLISIKDSLAVNSGTLTAGTSTSGATDRRETRTQVQEILAYEVGHHSLKFGGDIQRINSVFINRSDGTGTWSFDSAGDFLATLPSRFRQNFLTTSAQENTYTGVFAQDEWRLRGNFMLSYGLRFENETIIRDLNNFGPRVAFAFDPSTSGRLVIRGGAGIFYNRALLRTIDDFTTGSRQLFFDTDLLTDPLTGKILNDAQRRAFIDAHLLFPKPLTVDSPVVQQFAFGNTGTSKTGGLLRRLDPSLRIPESYQMNIGFEAQLRENLLLEVNYTWNRGLHLWREFNANAPVLPSGYKDFTEYLASQDFANFLARPGGVRPILNTSAAGELVRFVLAPPDPANPNAVVRPCRVWNSGLANQPEFLQFNDFCCGGDRRAQSPATGSGQRRSGTTDSRRQQLLSRGHGRGAPAICTS